MKHIIDAWFCSL